MTAAKIATPPGGGASGDPCRPSRGLPRHVSPHSTAPPQRGAHLDTLPGGRVDFQRSPPSANHYHLHNAARRSRQCAPRATRSAVAGRQPAGSTGHNSTRRRRPLARTAPVAYGTWPAGCRCDRGPAGTSTGRQTPRRSATPAPTDTVHRPAVSGVLGSVSGVWCRPADTQRHTSPGTRLTIEPTSQLP